MKTLHFQVFDQAGEPTPATLSVAYSWDVLMDDGTVFSSEPRRYSSATGVFDVEVLASDDPGIKDGYEAFTMTVSWAAIVPDCNGRMSTGEVNTRTVQVVMADPEPFDLAGLANVTPARMDGVWYGSGGGSGGGGGVETVSGTVTLGASGSPVREFYCTGAATIEGVAFAAGTAVVFRRTPAGVWGYIVVDPWTVAGGTTTTTTTSAGTTTTTTTSAGTTTTTTTVAATTTTTTVAATTTTTTTEAGWLPSNLTSSVLWLDANHAPSIDENAGLVTSWSSRVGSWSASQDIASNKPQTGVATINSRNVISFGADDSLRVPSFSGLTGSIQMTIWFIGTATSASDRILAELSDNAGTNAGSFALIRQANNTVALLQRPLNNSIYAQAVTTATLVGTPFVYVGTYHRDDATNEVRSYVNGTADGISLGTANNTSGQFATYNLSIASRAGSGLYQVGNTGEIGICSTAVTQADREKLEGYLAHKWGLAGALPGDHPYKSGPPAA